MLFKRRLCFVFSILFFGMFFLAGSTLAMQKLSEEDLDSIVAGSFSRFTMETDAGISRTTVDLNIRAEIYAEIDSFKAHYRPADRDVPLDASEWDQDWRVVSLGESMTPLKLEHFVFEAEFENFDAIDRRLLSVKMGFQTVTGKLTIADLRSFTGTYGGDNFFRIKPIDFLVDPGTGSEFIFDGDPMFIVFDSKGWTGGDVPVPPDYSRGRHPEASFENQPLVRFDFGGAVRNTLP